MLTSQQIGRTCFATEQDTVDANMPSRPAAYNCTVGHTSEEIPCVLLADTSRKNSSSTAAPTLPRRLPEQIANPSAAVQSSSAACARDNTTQEPLLLLWLLLFLLLLVLPLVLSLLQQLQLQVAASCSSDSALLECILAASS
jgi:beta-lactamase regulating signal transducer with metallopeptidase domain